MANHRIPDGAARRYTVLDSADRAPQRVAASPRAVAGRSAAVPAPRPAPPARPVPLAAPGPLAGPGPLAPRHPAPRTVAVAATSARRSSPDEIAAMASTTLIPSSPGARGHSGPIFVDGSGRRARRFKGVAAAAAALAAGYVGVVVTGALAGPSGFVNGGAVPVAAGASLAPTGAPAPAVVPSPVVATPADDVTTTTKKAKPRTTTKKAVPKATPKKVVPKVVPPPVVPKPVVPVVPPKPPVVEEPAETPEQPQQGGAGTKPAQQQPLDT